MIAAREILRRYPALRASWPVRQARAWREQQALRRNPRVMASWYRDMPDMQTRLFVSNLSLPEAPATSHPVDLAVLLFDERGRRVAARRFHLGPDGSLVLELRDLLPVPLRGRVSSGQVRIHFEGAELGSSRAYFHWYNDRSLTSSHEKFGLTIPAVAGYWAVPNVQHSESYQTRLAIVNLDESPYTSSITLKDADGRSAEAEVRLEPNGSRFAAIEDLFADPGTFLADRPGVLYFGNNRQPAMYYYFVANQRLGTWRAQHL